MNAIYKNSFKKIKNGKKIQGMDEIIENYDQEDYDADLISELDKLFIAPNKSSINKIYMRNIEILKEHKKFSRTDFVPIDGNENRLYEISEVMCYVFIKRTNSFQKIMTSSNDELDTVKKHTKGFLCFENLFNLSVLSDSYSLVEEPFFHGSHLSSFNTKKENYFQFHYENMAEFSLLLYFYHFEFYKPNVKAVFLIGDDSNPVYENKVNVLYCKGKNLGDTISPLIVDWMLKQRQISMDKITKKESSLLSTGSLCGMEAEDVTIWGSGFHTMDFLVQSHKNKEKNTIDFRAVRGPVTRYFYTAMGYECPEVYGDPGILFPLIYPGKPSAKKYKTSLIIHCGNENYDEYRNLPDIHFIDIRTNHYEFFVEELLASEKVISSALHGIILAESYGIGTVFLNTKGYVEKAMMKYTDWYLSTNRRNFKVAQSIEEAIEFEPEAVPDLTLMRENLMNAFPYDLWE